MLRLRERLEAPRTQGVERLTADDPTEPGREGRGLHQPWKATPRGDEGLLDHVAREIDVANEGDGGAVGQTLVASHELGEGSDVARARLLHEIDEVHGASSR
jgi:hypothetical protein